jgi:hypothetical protein
MSQSQFIALQAFNRVGSVTTGVVLWVVFTSGWIERLISMRELTQKVRELQCRVVDERQEARPHGAWNFELVTAALSSIFATAVTTACVLATGASAAAQAPVALVEDVVSKTAGVEFMDYVPVGKVIRLEPQDTIVLSYMKSCWQEAISGGTVTVGSEQSEVQLGRVERHKVDCDGGKLMLTAQLASQAAGMVFRDMRSGQQTSAPKPQITLYGLSPVIEIKGGGVLVIERVDQPGERHELAIAGQQLVNGTFYDLARVGTALVAGGIYRAKVNGRQLVFKVDPDAKPGASPVIGRLLRLQPAS